MVRLVAVKVRRLALTVFGVLTVAFFIQRLGGSPAGLLLPITATPEDIRFLNEALGYDRPLHVQFVSFVRDALMGDFGTSLTRPGVPAIDVVMGRLPATAQLAILSFVFAVVLSVTLAIVIRLTGSNPLRMLVVWAGQVRLAIPTFVFGLILIVVFAVGLGWLPSYGAGSWRHLVLPAASIGTFHLALYVRMMDSAFSETLGQDYVRTAASKGATERRILLRHMLPNAVLPVITVMGIHLGTLMSGAVVIETLFNYPGVGELFITSVHRRDFPVVLAALFVVSIIFVLINFVVDMLYLVIDPRART